MLDDRLEETIGFKLKEACLIGYPYLIVVGASLRKMGKFEVEVCVSLHKFHIAWFNTPTIGKKNRREDVLNGK